jgi:hypothetical protein
MSRTNKDKPHWVRTKWYVPVHIYCREASYSAPRLGLRYGRYRRPGLRDCDLPIEPVYANPRLLTWLKPPLEPSHCYWEATWPVRWNYPYTRPPRRDDRHLGWWGPDRRLVRDQCRKAIQEYHGSGDIEIIVSIRHHTHSPAKGWWD